MVDGAKRPLPTFRLVDDRNADTAHHHRLQKRPSLTSDVSREASVYTDGEATWQQPPVSNGPCDLKQRFNRFTNP